MRGYSRKTGNCDMMCMTWYDMIRSEQHDRLDWTRLDQTGLMNWVLHKIGR